ncbi:MAG TPA: cyclase family protein [Aliidongia sp.]|nr:cyclase family protein [Aliidongia sp.]
MTNPRWKHRPEGSNWGDFGPDDQLGRLNLLTPEKRRQAASEIREGLAFCLSLPLDYPGGNLLNPRRYPPQLRPTLRDGLPNMNFPLKRSDPTLIDVVCDDAALIHLQYSTQWDSLAHVGQLFDTDGDGVPEPVYYNGYRAHEHVLGPVRYKADRAVEPTHSELTGAQALGIETMAANCVQGSAVMVDLEAHVGRERAMIGYDKLMEILETDRVAIEPGDMVCLRTGFDKVILEMKRQPRLEPLEHSCAVIDGRDERLQRWITDSNLVALISDNYAVEADPARPGHGDCAALPLHAHCLFKLGIPLGELWHLSELADWLRANGRNRFMLTAPPLRLPGAVGSPVTPVGTV